MKVYKRTTFILVLSLLKIALIMGIISFTAFMFCFKGFELTKQNSIFVALSVGVVLFLVVALTVVYYQNICIEISNGEIMRYYRNKKLKKEYVLKDVNIKFIDSGGYKRDTRLIMKISDKNGSTENIYLTALGRLQFQALSESISSSYTKILGTTYIDFDSSK